jgi:hypothetical protein
MIQSYPGKMIKAMVSMAQVIGPCKAAGATMRSWRSFMRWLTVWMLLICLGFLSSCYWGDDDPPYPPIDKEQLVWRRDMGVVVEV